MDFDEFLLTNRIIRRLHSFIVHLKDSVSILESVFLASKVDFLILCASDYHKRQSQQGVPSLIFHIWTMFRNWESREKSDHFRSS